MKIRTEVRSTMAQELIAAMAAGSTNPNPLMEVYEGSEPASMGQTISDTLLGTLTLTDTVATEWDGIINFLSITQDSAADASGTAGWCRILNRDGEEVVYFSISDDGSGDIDFNTTSIVAGAPIAISSLQVIVGGA